MKSLLWVLCLAFQFFITSSQVSTTGWLSIDCGNESAGLGDNGLPWSIDQNFTQDGINKRLPLLQPHREMSTLRYFPNSSNPNCYTLPVSPKVSRYLIRVGFFYGNYDDLNHPPTFDVLIDEKYQLTIITTTSTVIPVYQEVMFATRGSSSITVCLKQTRDGEVPFISSLEIVPLGLTMFPNLYKQMKSDATFFLVNRTNFGGDEVRYTGFLSDEIHNRIWAAGPTPPNYSLIPTLPDLNPNVENDPPASVLRSSIASSNTSSPIIMTVDLPPQPTPQTAYFVFYFTEMPNIYINARIVDIYINGVMKETVTVDVNKCEVATVITEYLVDPMANITLAASNSSTLPPIISAMEVFTTVDHVQDHDKGSTGSAYDPFISISTIFIHVFVVLIFT